MLNLFFNNYDDLPGGPPCMDEFSRGPTFCNCGNINLVNQLLLFENGLVLEPFLELRSFDGKRNLYSKDEPPGADAACKGNLVNTTPARV